MEQHRYDSENIKMNILKTGNENPDKIEYFKNEHEKELANNLIENKISPERKEILKKINELNEEHDEKVNKLIEIERKSTEISKNIESVKNELDIGYILKENKEINEDLDNIIKKIETLADKIDRNKN